jgi:CRP/FNR family transcriptional regulator, cyclic AMP receptor protein
MFPMSLVTVPVVTPLISIDDFGVDTFQSQPASPGLRLVDGTETVSGLARLAKTLTDSDHPVQQLRSGEPLFHEGHPGGALYVLLSGVARSSARTTSGTLISTRVHHAVSLLGLTATATPELAHCETVHAITPMSVRIVSQRGLATLRKRCPWVSDILTEELAMQMRTMVERTVSLCHLDSQAKVAAAILQAVGPASTIAVTQDVIADLAGVARPTANSALRDFELSEIVALARGRITVLQRSMLERIAR